jgi:carbon storage regulator
MLILTRRVEEKVIIGDEVTVTVLASKGGYVRLGIDAPRKIPVHREEIYRRMKQEEAGGRGRVIAVESTPTEIVAV